ncbi:hypothetical protein NFI96_019330, partial [Prochilodus magdalenae]
AVVGWTWQSRAGQGIRGLARAGHSWACQGRAFVGLPGQGIRGLARAGHSWAGQGRAGYRAFVAGQGQGPFLAVARAGQSWAGQGRAFVGWPGQGIRGLARAGHSWAGQGRAFVGWPGQGSRGLARAGQSWAGQGRAVVGWAGQGSRGLGWAGQSWAGLGWAVVGWAGQSWAGLAAAFFVTYEGIKSLLAGAVPAHMAPVTHMVAASLGETVACLIRVPTEVVKQRAQASPSLHTHHVLLTTLREEGVRGLYRGFGSTVLREHLHEKALMKELSEPKPFIYLPGRKKTEREKARERERLGDMSEGSAEKEANQKASEREMENETHVCVSVCVAVLSPLSEGLALAGWISDQVVSQIYLTWRCLRLDLLELALSQIYLTWRCLRLDLPDLALSQIYLTWRCLRLDLLGLALSQVRSAWPGVVSGKISLNWRCLRLDLPDLALSQVRSTSPGVVSAYVVCVCAAGSQQCSQNSGCWIDAVIRHVASVKNLLRLSRMRSARRETGLRVLRSRTPQNEVHEMERNRSHIGGSGDGVGTHGPWLETLWWAGAGGVGRVELFAGAVAAFVTTPLDVAKTRIMLAK